MKIIEKGLIAFPGKAIALRYTCGDCYQWANIGFKAACCHTLRAIENQTMKPSDIYIKGDIRRTLSVLGAIESLGNSASLASIGGLTGYDNKTIQHQLKHACQQMGVQVIKKLQFYTIKDWGPVIKKSGAMLALRGTFPDGRLIVDLDKE